MQLDVRSLPGLDVWRAILLIAGVFLHVATIAGDGTWAFRAIFLFSQSFRMGAFFVIAGVLASLVVTRHGPSIWLNRRLSQLGVPLIFSFLLILPLCYLMDYRLRGAPALDIGAHHLWFLISLLGFSFASVALENANSRIDLYARIDTSLLASRQRWVAVIGALGLSTFCLFAIGLLISNLTARMGIRVITDHLFAYLPAYLFGHFIVRCPNLRNTMFGLSRECWLLIVTIAVTYVAFAISFDRVPVSVSYAGGSIAPFAASILILRSAFAIRRVPAGLAALSQASFTIYLIHYPIIMALTLGMKGSSMGVHHSYLLLVATTLTLSCILHFALVKRFKVFAFLLNGKPLPNEAIIIWPLSTKGRVELFQRLNH